MGTKVHVNTYFMLSIFRSLLHGVLVYCVFINYNLLWEIHPCCSGNKIVSSWKSFVLLDFLGLSSKRIKLTFEHPIVFSRWFYNEKKNKNKPLYILRAKIPRIRAFVKQEEFTTASFVETGFSSEKLINRLRKKLYLIIPEKCLNLCTF